jgi:hypothetical protein
MADLKDFELAKRSRTFWGEQLDMAQVMGERQHIEHAARKYFDAADWLVRLHDAAAKARRIPARNELLRRIADKRKHIVRHRASRIHIRRS